jgi:hypothetical protein
MTPTIEQLAEEAAKLDPSQFADFLRRVTDKRLNRGVPVGPDDEQLLQEDLALSQQTLAEDWEGVPDDWEAGGCPSRCLSCVILIQLRGHLLDRRSLGGMGLG